MLWIEDKVKFKNLGLAVIDEQHWKQRSKYGENTISFAMTANSIPRTLAKEFVLHLDISGTDELPPGRKPIQTVHRFDSNRLKVWKFIRDEITLDVKYIVYPPSNPRIKWIIKI
jgi:ATP-dependent DNA helicase RecG